MRLGQWLRLGRLKGRVLWMDCAIVGWNMDVDDWL
jgi:hypothetical protein